MEHVAIVKFWEWATPMNYSPVMKDIMFHALMLINQCHNSLHTWETRRMSLYGMPPKYERNWKGRLLHFGQVYPLPSSSRKTI